MVQGIRDTLVDEEANPTQETHRPTHAGHLLVKKLGCIEGYDLYLGDKPYFGISRRAIIKTAARRSPGYQTKRRRLLEEARIASVFHHPNLAPLLDAGEDDEGTHLVFDHVDGTNLSRACSAMRVRNEAFPFELCAWITNEVLRGAGYAHLLRHDDGTSLRLVLRDLVPANVLVSTNGQIKLATFALPLVPHGDDARPHPDAAAYLAPERIARDRCDGRADVYAAGVLLFELLFGRACYHGHRTREVIQKVMHSGIPIALLAAEGVPEDLVEMVKRATARRPEDRYESAPAFARELSDWLERSDQSATPSTVARFFDRQGLFDEDAKPVKLREVLDHDATTRAISVKERHDTERCSMEAVFEKTLEQEEPIQETLSALILREEIIVDERSRLIPPLPPPASIMPMTIHPGINEPPRRAWIMALMIGASIGLAIASIIIVVGL